MSSITNHYKIYLPMEGSFEKQIHDEIHLKFISNCIQNLLLGNSIAIRYMRIHCHFSNLSDKAQKYLLSQGCSQDRNVEVLLNVEESLIRIQDAFSKGLIKELLYSSKGKTNCPTDDHQFLAFKLTYVKPKNVNQMTNR